MYQLQGWGCVHQAVISAHTEHLVLNVLCRENVFIVDPCSCYLQYLVQFMWPISSNRCVVDSVNILSCTYNTCNLYIPDKKLLYGYQITKSLSRLSLDTLVKAKIVPQLTVPDSLQHIAAFLFSELQTSTQVLHFWGKPERAPH